MNRTTYRTTANSRRWRRTALRRARSGGRHADLADWKNGSRFTLLVGLIERIPGKLLLGTSFFFGLLARRGAGTIAGLAASFRATTRSFH